MPHSAWPHNGRVACWGGNAREWASLLSGRGVEGQVCEPIDDPTAREAFLFVAEGERARLSEALEAASRYPAAVLQLREADIATHPLRGLMAALVQAKADWEHAFDAIVDGVAVLDETARVRRANRSFARILGRSFEDTLGHDCRALLGIQDSQDASNTALTSGLAGTDVQLPEVGFPGLSGVFELTVSPIQEGGAVHGAVLILKDVTTAVEQRRRLELSHRLADVGRLAGGVAHEISTPLASIALRAESLIRKAQDPALNAIATFADFSRYLKTIDDEAFRCKRIIGALLEFGQPRRPEVTQTDLNGLVDRAIALVGDHMRARRVELARSLAVELPTVLIDAAQIREALIALLLNAADACEQGGQVKVATTFASATSVEVEISDTGVGIAPDHLDKVFVPFFTTKPVGQGTGLGLAICQRIIAAHGGQIWLDSVLGEGTKARISLPLREAQDRPPAAVR